MLTSKKMEFSDFVPRKGQMTSRWVTTQSSNLLERPHQRSYGGQNIPRARFNVNCLLQMLQLKASTQKKVKQYKSYFGTIFLVNIFIPINSYISQMHVHRVPINGNNLDSITRITSYK